MANPLDNPILIDGTMILDETLGSYAKSTLNPYNPSYYVSLGSWSDTLGVIEESSTSTVDSGYSEVIIDNYSLVDSTIDKLKTYAEELLKKLSSKLIEFSWAIPDVYNIEFTPIFNSDSVYMIFSEEDSIDKFSIITKITLRRAGYKFVTEFDKNDIDSGFNSLKEKLNLLFNGIILFLSSGISVKE